MNSQTSVTSVWNSICKIKGNDTSNTVHHLYAGDWEVMPHPNIANALADSFSHNSIPSIHKKAERKAINTSSDNAELYNRPLFTMAVVCLSCLWDDAYKRTLAANPKE